MADEDFGIKIKVDPTSATPAIAGLKKQLDDLEAKGPTVGKAIGAGFTSTAQAMRQASAAAEKTTREFKGVADSIRAEKLDAAARAFAGLAAQMEREASVLDRIRGPQKRYMEDLQALDGLLHRQLISTQEYAEQVTALNQAIEKTPRVDGSAGGMSRGQNGLRSYLAQTIGGGTSSLFTGASVEAAAIAGLGAASVKLGSDYINLRNQAERLASSEDQVDNVLGQQLTLSKQLHSGMSDTIQLSATMKEHVAELGLTTQQTTDFTKRWGEISVLTNHQLGESGSNFERLSTALESGMAGGRGLRQTLTEFPQVLTALEQHFHTTEAGIFALGKAGKLSMNDVIDSVNEAGAAIDAQMNARVETAGQQWQHFKDELALGVGKLAESSGLIKDLGGAFDALGTAISKTTDALDKLGHLDVKGAANAFKGTNADSGVNALMDNKFLGGPITSALGPLREFRDLAGDGVDKIRQLKLTEQQEAQLSNAQGFERIRLLEEWVRKSDAASDGTKSWGQSLGDVVSKMDQIRAHAAAGAILDMVNSLTDKYKQLIPVLDHVKALTADAWAPDGAEGFLARILPKGTAAAMAYAHGIGEAKKQLADLNAAYHAHAVSADYFKSHRDSLITEIYGPHALDDEKYIESLTKPLKEIHEHQRALTAAFHAGGMQASFYYAEFERLTEAAKRYEAEMLKLQAEGMFRSFIEQHPSAIVDVKEAAQPYINAARSLGHKFGLVPSMADALATAAANKPKKDQHDQLEAQKKALEDYKQQVKSTAEELQHAFEPLNAEIMKGVVEGKANWADFGRNMLESLGEAILKAIELKAIMAAMPAAPAGGALPDLGGIGSALHFLGFAQGGSFTIPAAAQGLSGTFGGIGRTDSQIAAFRVTPGEHFTIQTPAQHAAAQHGGGPMSVKVINVGDHKQAALEAMASDEGEQVVLNTLSRNPALIRGIVGKV